MIDHVRKSLTDQYLAVLWMLKDCVEKCPEEHWDGKIAHYTFWNVAYHALCFADLYLSPREADWVPQAIHPAGMKELSEEFPSRRFERGEMLEYVEYCRQKAVKEIQAETERTLAGPAGFSWYKNDRLQMHFVNIRHVQHHTGQLSAYLRRLGIDAKWQGSGWRA